MKFSVFTPTHDPRYLTQAYDSLLAQTCPDWEWVVLANGSADRIALQDQRVRVLHAPDTACGVGALKHYACRQCTGDMLVELDHDDLLAPTALAKLADCDEDFIYSDAANFRADGEFQLYGTEWGWEHYEAEVDGKRVKVNRSFEPDASSLRQIFYAPNHVRAWRRTLYEQLGGHNPALPVCDDFDLVVRTYLAGASFKHLSECLYLYRMREDGNNTFLARNADIQVKQAELGDANTHALVHEWCRREGLVKIDLGSGLGSPDGFVPHDLRLGVDLRQPWPYPDSSVGCVRAYDFLEHIPHCRDSSCTHQPPFCTVGLMNEIYRVLVPGGWLLSATPSTDGRGAFQDPTHCSFWNPNSFWYYTRQQQRQYVPGIVARFQPQRIWQNYPSDWHQQHLIAYVFAELVALKGQRQPGLKEV